MDRSLLSRKRVYNRRPAVVEAMILELENIQAIEGWLRASGGSLTRLGDGSFWVTVRGKGVPIELGQVLVRESTGMFYVYELRVFEAMYA